MRASAIGGRFRLEDVEPELEDAVTALAFARDGGSFLRVFPADAPYADVASKRFVDCAPQLVRQAAGLEPSPWADALETVVERAGVDGWWLAGSAALAVRGLAVEPRDLDLISDAHGCAELAAALADLLVEPLVDGGYLGDRWFRAFAGARIECVGGVHAAVDADEPSDFGLVAGSRLETVRWRGHLLRVPPLALQLRACERRGLDERARLIRELLC